MKLKKIDYTKIMLKEDASISKTYITSVQNNTFHEVHITPSECRKSGIFFSRLKKDDTTTLEKSGSENE